MPAMLLRPCSALEDSIALYRQLGFTLLERGAQHALLHGHALHLQLLRSPHTGGQDILQLSLTAQELHTLHSACDLHAHTLANGASGWLLRDPDGQAIFLRQRDAAPSALA
ncbi:hypothetical protein V8J88_22360 [Massilia sp. W12]|uniref:hypothetical protein n=1 Tax=Massilia sp. W12 TaxID=3126507 RepID=UPI0030D1A218